MADGSFLAEVEDFLASCDLPSLASIEALQTGDDDRSDSADSRPDASERVDGAAAKPRPVSRGRKKSQTNVDAATKRELKKANDRKRRSAYRERQKVERESLKQQVGELASTLTQLEKPKEVEDQVASSAWKAIAQRQLQARLSAEAQQRRLLAAIDARAAMIQDMDQFVRDRLSSEVDLVEGDLGEAAYQHKRMRLEPSDAEIYLAYIHELDALYGQVDDILQACGLDATKEGSDDSQQKWTEDGKTGYYQFMDKRVIPFDFERTCQFAWQVAQMVHRQEARQVFELEDPENTAAMKFRITTRLKSGRVVSVLQRSVCRRFKEVNRHVIVWRALTEGEGMFTGMHADETGCCVATRSTDTSEVGTVLRTYIRNVPMHFSRAKTQELEVKEFTGVVLDSGTEDSAEIANRLKKLMLEEA